MSTRLALAELLLSGCTTASDHHYVFTEGLEDAIDLQVEESKNLGIRVVLCRGSMDRSQKDGGLPPDSIVQTCDKILAKLKLRMLPSQVYMKKSMQMLNNLEKLSVKIHNH